MKKYKCVGCGKVHEVEPTQACECGGLKFSETTEVKIEIVQQKADGQDAIFKMLADISGAVKDIKGTQSEQAEKMKKIEEDTKAALAQKDALDKDAASRKATYEIEQSDLHFKALLATKGLANIPVAQILDMPSKDELVRDFQSKNDDLYVLGMLLAQKGLRLVDTKLYHTYKAQPSVKAMTASGSGAGSDWIPTGFSSQLIELVNLELKVANLHPRDFMPTSPFKKPGVSTNLKAYRSTGAAAGSDAPTKFTASNYGTRNVTYNAELLTARVVYELDLEEDSIVSMLPSLKANIAYAIAAAIESTIINGDDSANASCIDATDMHGGAISNTSPSKCWNGYRKHAANINAAHSGKGVTDLAGAFLTTGLSFKNARANMGKYGLYPQDLAIVTSVQGYLKSLQSMRDVQTLQNYGPSAVILSGELGKAYGIPIVVSQYQREDLNGSGVSGGSSSGNNDTAMQIIFKNGFSIGDRRKITIESAKIQGTDSVEIWATARLDFQSIYATSEYTVHNLVDLY